MKRKSSVPIPDPGEGKRGETGYIGYLLRQASNVTRQALERSLEDLDVTAPQFLLMTLINAYPGSSGADLARAAMLTPQTVSLVISNLERDGRLTRARDPEHGRIQRLDLTETGIELLKLCRERSREIEAQLAASMPPGLESEIRHWLAEIARLDLTAS